MPYPVAAYCNTSAVAGTDPGFISERKRAAAEGTGRSPYVYGENKDKIIESLIYKIDGIECYHYSVNDEQTRELLKLCISNNLNVTGGSDWHGKPNKRNPVNVQVPDNLINQF